ncbi:hypothetical protein AB0N17_37545 [Streptomyces sp. NPDC051133]
MPGGPWDRRASPRADRRGRGRLYQHDLGVVRLRRMYRSAAEEQASA